ncbi:unnamed protein product [Sphagnum balticum]
MPFPIIRGKVRFFASLVGYLSLLTSIAAADFLIFRLAVPLICEHFRLDCRCGFGVHNRRLEVQTLSVSTESKNFYRITADHLNSTAEIDVVIGLVTMERHPLLRYLTLTVTTLVRQLFDYNGAKRFAVLLCNVDASPQHFSEFRTLTNQTAFSIFPVVFKHSIRLHDGRLPKLSGNALFEAEKRIMRSACVLRSLAFHMPSMFFFSRTMRHRSRHSSNKSRC